MKTKKIILLGVFLFSVEVFGNTPVCPYRVDASIMCSGQRSIGYNFAVRRGNSRQTSFARNDAQKLLLLIKLQKGNLARYNKREVRRLIHSELDRLTVNIQNNFLSKNSIVHGLLSFDSVERLEEVESDLISAKNSLPNIDENWTDQDLENLANAFTRRVELGISDARNHFSKINSDRIRMERSDSFDRNSREYQRLVRARDNSRYSVFTDNCKVLSSTALDDIINRNQECRDREASDSGQRQQGQGRGN